MNKEFVGYEGDLLKLGVTEGGGAPILVIYEAGTSRSFVFRDPQQVDELIITLLPFGTRPAIVDWDCLERVYKDEGGR